MAKLFSYLEKHPPKTAASKTTSGNGKATSEQEAFLKEAGAQATELAGQLLVERQRIEGEIEKIAASKDPEKEYGFYVKLGQDLAYGMASGFFKAAIEGEEPAPPSEEEAALAETIETVAAQAAEALAEELPDEALEDPQVQEEIAQAAEEAAQMIVEEALAASEGSEGAGEAA